MTALARPKMRTEDRKQLVDEQDALKAKQDGLRDDRLRAAARVDELATEIASLTSAREELDRQIEQATTRQQVVQEQLGKLDEQSAEITQRLAELAEQIGRLDPNTGKPVQEDKLREGAKRFGEFSAKDLAAVAQVTKAAATKWIKAQVEAGQVRATGSTVLGQMMYESLEARAEEQAEHSKAFHDVRDYAVKQKEPFSPKKVTEATEVDGQDLVTALQELLRMGVLEYVGFDDLELYAYVPPTEMGVAAEKDAQRRKDRAKTATHDPGIERGVAIEGTGGRPTVTNADVRALVNAIYAAGGSVSRAGNSHWEVTAPGTRKRVLISSTPRSRRSVLNDRARVRRELGLAI